MPDDSTLHRGDIALLDAMTVTAARAQYLNLLGALDYRSGEITADDIRGVEDVLHRTLGQADWLARGTRGLVLLLDYCVNQVLANETRLDPGHANSMAVQALVLDFCRRHWPDRVTVVRAAGEGLAACVALLRTHGGDTNGPGEGNKGLVRTILSQMDGECLRGALESALEQAHCDRDRLALAGAALVDMERLLSNKGEPAWQPFPRMRSLAGLRPDLPAPLRQQPGHSRCSVARGAEGCAAAHTRRGGGWRRHRVGVGGVQGCGGGLERQRSHTIPQSRGGVSANGGAACGRGLSGADGARYRNCRLGAVCAWRCTGHAACRAGAGATQWRRQQEAEP